MNMVADTESGIGMGDEVGSVPGVAMGMGTSMETGMGMGITTGMEKEKE